MPNKKKNVAAFIFNHLNILLLLLGLVIIICAERIVTSLHYILGITLMVYSLFVFIFTMVKHKKVKLSVFSSNISASIVTLLAGLVILCHGENSILIIGVAWAIFGLFKGGRELGETIKKIIERKSFVISLLQAIITLTLAVILVLDPINHMGVHMIILGVEIIIVSMKSYKSKSAFIKALPFEEETLGEIFDGKIAAQKDAQTAFSVDDNSPDAQYAVTEVGNTEQTTNANTIDEKPKKDKPFLKAVKKTRVIPVFIGLMLYVLLFSSLLRYIEPQIATFWQGLVYSLKVMVSIGLGGVAPITVAGKILTYLLSLYGLAFLVLVTVLLTGYYIEVQKYHKQSDKGATNERNND